MNAHEQVVPGSSRSDGPVSGSRVPDPALRSGVPEDSVRPAQHPGLPHPNLARLAPALTRELNEAAIRAAHRQAQRDRIESEERFRALTELSSDWYWEHDEHERFTHMSGPLLKNSGVRASDMIGRTRWETGLTGDPAIVAALKADIAARRPFRDVELRRTNPDGTTRHVSISGRPMSDESGRYRGYRGVGRDISASERAQKRLRFQALLLETVGDAIVACDTDGIVNYINGGAEKLYGWTAAEVLGRPIHDTVRPAANREFWLAARREVAGGTVWRGEADGRRRDGTIFPVSVTLAPVRNAEGVLTGIIGVSVDISERKRMEQAFRDKAAQQGLIAAFGLEALANADLPRLLDRSASAVGEGLGADFGCVFELGADGLSLITRAGTILDDTGIAHDLGDSTPGTYLRHALEAREAVVVADFNSETRFTSCPFLARLGIRSGVATVISGSDRPFGVLGAFSRDVDRFPPESVDFLQSIANTLGTAIGRRYAEEKFAYLSHFDTQTGLPNRDVFRDRLWMTLTHARSAGNCVAIMVVDLDHFEVVNNTIGRAAGDRLLVQIARRLEGCLPENCSLGRHGGDKFAIALPDLLKSDDANVVLQRVAEGLARPFTIDGQDLRLTASLGIAVFPDDGDDAELLLTRAETATYRAKKQGGNLFQFYTRDLQGHVARRIAVERELRVAIERQEFVLHYQPEISLDSGRIIGVEALIRWQHPVRGLLAPGEFIAVAEETGLIMPIGQWVVDAACAQIAQWREHGHRDLFVAVNVSPLELRRGDPVAHISAALARHAVDPTHFEIEVTETMGIGGAESFVHTLDALKSIGIMVAIDDFGTGYSILSYLKRFPIDTLKIDRSFVTDIVTDSDDAAIVRAIIAMAHELQVSVTAEGVETEEQAGFLRRLHCDRAQGFLLGRPMPAAQLGALLDARGGTDLRPSARRSKRSLLLVDSDHGNLWALNSVLSHDGYAVHTATSAQQALELLEAHPIAVVVADQQLAGTGGIELLRQIGARHPNTVRIVLSGYADITAVAAAINGGELYKFMIKPWDNGELRDNVWQAFRRHEELTAHALARG